MAPFSGVVNALAILTVLGFGGRAALKLLQNPDVPHDELVPAWERRVTTLVGAPLLLVGASTLMEGPLAVHYSPMALLLPGIVLFLYPNFAPSPVA